MSGDGTTDFSANWFGPLARVAETWRQEKRLYQANPGFVNAAFQTLLAVCTVLSLHHILRARFPKHRYVVGDIYVVAWLVFVAASTSCALDGPYQACLSRVPYWTTDLIVYRLVEILSRELWIILYRQKPITSFPRVLSVAILNYAMATGLFGYLYDSGIGGFQKAAVISLTFAPLEPIDSTLEIFQGAYCLAFLIVVLAVFVARATLPDHAATRHDSQLGGTVADTNGAAGKQVDLAHADNAAPAVAAPPVANDARSEAPVVGAAPRATR